MLRQKLARWLTLWVHLLRGPETVEKPAWCLRCAQFPWFSPEPHTRFRVNHVYHKAMHCGCSAAELHKQSWTFPAFFFSFTSAPCCASLQLPWPSALFSSSPLCYPLPPPPTLWAKSLAFLFYLSFSALHDGQLYLLYFFTTCSPDFFLPISCSAFVKATYPSVSCLNSRSVCSCCTSLLAVLMSPDSLCTQTPTAATNTLTCTDGQCQGSRVCSLL